MNKTGMIVILSAPSGCGKDTVFKEISKIRSDVCESVSATTRSPRKGEIDGVNYFLNMPAITVAITAHRQHRLLRPLVKVKFVFLL